MKAILINENINFERKVSPKKSLNLGSFSPEYMEKEREEFQKMLENIGILSEWSPIWETYSRKTPIDKWNLKLENKTSDLSAKAPFSNTEIFIYYSPTPKNIFEGENLDFIIDGGGSPWAMSDVIDNVIYLFDNAGKLLKKYLELEYDDSNSWNYLEHMKKIINILES